MFDIGPSVFVHVTSELGRNVSYEEMIVSPAQG